MVKPGIYEFVAGNRTSASLVSSHVSIRLYAISDLLSKRKNRNGARACTRSCLAASWMRYMFTSVVTSIPRGQFVMYNIHFYYTDATHYSLHTRSLAQRIALQMHRTMRDTVKDANSTRHLSSTGKV